MDDATKAELLRPRMRTTWITPDRAREVIATRGPFCEIDATAAEIAEVKRLWQHEPGSWCQFDVWNAIAGGEYQEV